MKNILFIILVLAAAEAADQSSSKETRGQKELYPKPGEIEFEIRQDDDGFVLTVFRDIGGRVGEKLRLMKKSLKAID